MDPVDVAGDTEALDPGGIPNSTVAEAESRVCEKAGRGTGGCPRGVGEAGVYANAEIIGHPPGDETGA